MVRVRSLQKIAGLLGAGVIGGVGLVYYAGTTPTANASSLPEPGSSGVKSHRRIRGHVIKSYPEPVTFISVPWNSNWDFKGTDDAVTGNDKSKKGENVTGSTEHQETVAKPKASRHIYLIRHGQYDMTKDKDKDRKLTPLGRKQASKTGERLKNLNIKFDKIVHSDMTRAIETANLVSESLPHVPMSSCSLLREGSPCRPEPATSSQFDDWEIHEEGSRIEAAFRKYFHRADVTQEQDSYEVIVCHGNVIRYFACRALQFPPDGWLRMHIGHCGVTRITIRPSGRVSMKALGDTGHLPPELLTFS